MSSRVNFSASKRGCVKKRSRVNRKRCVALATKKCGATTKRRSTTR